MATLRQPKYVAEMCKIYVVYLTACFQFSILMTFTET